MALKEKLQNDLTEAMRARDEVRSSTIRMVLTAIKNEEVSGKEARDLSDAEVITVLSREAKKRREAAEAFEEAGAKDRADNEKAEGVIIAQYLPEQLSEAEIKEMIASAIKETGAAGPQQMGLVMKSIQPKIAGRADGGIVSSLVKAALSGGNYMKFEYATVPLLNHATKQILDTWGSDGWELVQVIPAPGGGDQLVAYMKREIK
jgi:uncharacterized protein YqeY